MLLVWVYLGTLGVFGMTNAIDESYKASLSAQGAQHYKHGATLFGSWSHFRSYILVKIL